MQHILAIDQGTTGSTALIFDENLEIKGKANEEFPQHFPQASWVEHDLDEIWTSVTNSIRRVLEVSSLDPKSIAAIGITNQRETTCLWHRDENATPVGKAIVWQDRRTADLCRQLKKRGLEKKITRKTGLLLDPYFSGTKLSWMLKNIPGVQALATKGAIAFGTIDSYLLYRMSGEHKTEPSNACRTMLMNLKKLNWDDEMLKIFKIPKTILPEIHPSSVEYGKTRNVPHLPDGIPITGMAGDQQAALFGQACFKKGSAKSTYGTGAFVLANVGSEPIYSKHRLLSSVAWQIGKKPTYCLEGSAFIAGAAVQWLRDNLKLVPNSPAIESLARSVEDSDGVTFVPALAGMGAPHWLAGATGMITGITRRTSSGHLALATLEGIAFQVWELLEAMNKDFKKKIHPLKVDGGASANDLLMQFQADLLGVDVVRSKIVETTALGSGLQAGLAVGIWSSLDDIEKAWKAAETFEPKMKSAESKKHKNRWSRAMKAVKLLSSS